DESVREAICSTLGYAFAEHRIIVVEAGSGEEALALFAAAADQGRPFEAVLTDNQMPGIDGIELTRRVKALRSTTMVGMISGDHGLRDAAMQAGASGFLSKPLEVEALRAMVKGFAQVAGAVARQTV
ncbi:MAG: response regulator, partial [Candidatus Sungbacteria bacterium]|nr:response regulator [Candidatus Sungbacteria bacterium]